MKKATHSHFQKSYIFLFFCINTKKTEIHQSFHCFFKKQMKPSTQLFLSINHLIIPLNISMSSISKI